MSYYVHSVPGRLRIKIPSLKKNPQTARELTRLLNNLSGIRSVEVSTVTGSVVIRHDPEVLNGNAIISLLSGEGYIDLVRALPHSSRSDSALSSIGEVASRALIGFAIDRAFQGTPLSILTAFI